MQIRRKLSDRTRGRDTKGEIGICHFLPSSSAIDSTRNSKVDCRLVSSPHDLLNNSEAILVVRDDREETGSSFWSVMVALCREGCLMKLDLEVDKTASILIKSVGASTSNS